jgi:hypothetical protein
MFGGSNSQRESDLPNNQWCLYLSQVTRSLRSPANERTALGPGTYPWSSHLEPGVLSHWQIQLLFLGAVYTKMSTDCEVKSHLAQATKLVNDCAEFRTTKPHFPHPSGPTAVVWSHREEWGILRISGVQMEGGLSEVFLEEVAFEMVVKDK